MPDAKQDEVGTNKPTAETEPKANRAEMATAIFSGITLVVLAITMWGVLKYAGEAKTQSGSLNNSVIQQTNNVEEQIADSRPVVLANGIQPTKKSYYRKLWIRCGNERGGVPFRVDHAKPGGSRVEGDATNAEGSGKRGFKGSQLGFV